MSSLRCLGICLISLAFISPPLPLQAVTTTSLTPPAGTGSTGATATPPRVAPAPALPGAPPASAGALPPVIAPAQPAAPQQVPSAPPLGTPLPEGSEPEKSVVQIITEFVEPNWAAPWIFDLPRGASGTGFLIDGNRIMTNAHVVAWTTELKVRRYHDPQLYFAKVEYVAHDIDLAVLKIIDPKTHEEDPNSDFYKGMKPLDFGPLPKVRSSVVTYGFPAGGEQISYTRGVVSRIEVEGYVHPGNRAFLAVQTDAAINPGNSGGPVIQDDKVVGVAFEGMTGLQSTGYFIPTVVIHHFLDDIKDGTYDGVPEAGLRMSALQNPAFRHMLKLPEDSKQGVRVDQVLDIPTTRAVVKPDDVVMQVGDYPVDDDGTITYDGNTVGVSAAIDLAQNGDIIPLKIWRDGRLIDVKLPVKVYNDDKAQGNQYDVLPPYYVYGGLVFTPLSLDYLKTFGQDWSDAAGRDLIYELVYRHIEDPKHWRPEPVVLASILDHPVNANFATRGQAMVDKINGMPIERLSDVPKAFAATTGPDVIIEFLPDHHFEVIRKDAAEKANPEILDTYSVPAQSRL
ncbi:MAG TPA: trypsin-like peptidase domain-containing protein [Candidatus Methylacidiphilales bacterium]|nr:trypsin-like peptidase domain-containing protein [Candidatus Methylacidiphilales bacterium]